MIDWRRLVNILQVLEVFKKSLVQVKQLSVKSCVTDDALHPQSAPAASRLLQQT